MKLSDMSIRRPVLASMISLALVLFGAIGYTRLAVREFPDVDPPIVSVSTQLPGANPQVVESAVTDILEEELSTVEGLRTLTSSSQEGVSNITLEFNLDRGVESAAQDVRDKVARVRGRLPEDVREPVVTKQEADAQPFYWLALSGENYDLLQLSDIGDRLVKGRLQTLPGVGQARIFGERRFSMRIWLSAAELSARGLTVQDVQQAIRTRNVEIPAGRIESERREFTVRSLGELKTPEEFSNLVVSNSGGVLVKLKDLGRVELGAEDERSALRFKSTRLSPSVWSGSPRRTSRRWPRRFGASCPEFRRRCRRACGSTWGSTNRSSCRGPSAKPRIPCFSRPVSWSSSSSSSFGISGRPSFRVWRSRLPSSRRLPSCISSASRSTTSPCSR